MRKNFFFGHENEEQLNSKTRQATLELKFFSSHLQCWRGEFFDRALCAGYVCNLAKGDARCGERIRVQVDAFDKQLGLWKLTMLKRVS